MVFFYKKEYKKSDEYLQKTLEVDYSNSIAHLYRAKIAFNDGKLNQALNHSIKAQVGDFPFYSAILLQGDVYSKYNQNSEAMILWKKIVKKEPKYYPAWKRIKKYE